MTTCINCDKPIHEETNGHSSIWAHDDGSQRCAGIAQYMNGGFAVASPSEPSAPVAEQEKPRG